MKKTQRCVGSMPGSGRSPGGGNGIPLQYSCLGNSMDREAWQITVQRVAKRWTQLSTYTHCKIVTFIFTLALNKLVNLRPFPLSFLSNLSYKKYSQTAWRISNPPTSTGSVVFNLWSISNKFGGHTIHPPLQKYTATLAKKLRKKKNYWNLLSQTYLS